MSSSDERPTPIRIFLTALRLGCTSFGGPIAHLGYFHEEYVRRLRWIEEEAYADIVALCQFLPGPASSQVGFAIGLLRGGLAGGLASWLGFTLPSAALMIGFAYGLSAVGAGVGWLHGLNLAAVAVVAQAVTAMWRRLCPDWPRSALAAASALLLLRWDAGWAQLAVLGAGALAGRLLLPSAPPSHPGLGVAPERRMRRWSLVCLGLFLTPLALLPAWAGTRGWWAEAFACYRAGSLVFGGGHVILPLLQSGMVSPGWIGTEPFLAGYGAAQALPGPLVTFAAYLGAVLHPGDAIGGGLWALAWVFAPALLIVLAVLPWWRQLRSHPAAGAAMQGANAAVVGLLLAALIDPIARSTLRHPLDGAVALAGYGLLHVPRVSPWMVVLACALAGAVIG